MVALQRLERTAGGRVAEEDAALLAGDRQDPAVRAVDDRVRDPAGLEAEGDTERGRYETDVHLLAWGHGGALPPRVGEQRRVRARSDDRALPQPGAVDAGPPQAGAEQAGAGQVGAGEVRPAQVGLVEAGGDQPGAAHDRAGEIGTGQDGVGEVGVGEVHRPHLPVRQVLAAQ